MRKLSAKVQLRAILLLSLVVKCLCALSCLQVAMFKNFRFEFKLISFIELGFNSSK